MGTGRRRTRAALVSALLLAAFWVLDRPASALTELVVRLEYGAPEIALGESRTARVHLERGPGGPGAGDPMLIDRSDPDHSVFLIPSCSSARVRDCTAPSVADPGALGVGGTGTGVGGTACEGRTFELRTVDPGTGRVELVPHGGAPIVLEPVTSGARSTCAIDFDITMHRFPQHGSGHRTVGIAYAGARLAGLAVQPTGRGSDVLSVVRAPTRIEGLGAPAEVPLGSAVRAASALAGEAPGLAGPTGTVTFRAWGPQDPACAGVPDLSGAVDVDGYGEYASPELVTSLPGRHRWRAEYSGDANHEGSSSPCGGSSAETVVLPVAGVGIDVEASPESLMAPGGAVTIGVRLRNTGDEVLTVTGLRDDVAGDIRRVPEPNTCDELLGASIAPGGSARCSYRSEVTGTIDESVTRSVTVVAQDLSGLATAAVGAAGLRLTAPPPPAVSIALTPEPARIPASGGQATVRVRIANTGSSDLVIEALADDTTGDLSVAEVPGSCGNLLGTRLPEGARADCSYQIELAAGAPGKLMYTVRVVGRDPFDRVAEAEGLVELAQAGPTLEVRAGTRIESGRPGIALELVGDGYDCERVWFFFDGARVGSAAPDAAGSVVLRQVWVPGDSAPGIRRVASACSDSARTILTEVEFDVLDASLHRSTVMTALPQPGDVDLSARSVGLSALTTALLALLIAFPGALFDSTLEQNYERIRGWFPHRRAGRLSRRLSRMASTPVLRHSRLPVFLMLGGAAGAFLEPGFGWNLTTLALATGMTLTLMLLTAVFSLPGIVYVGRNYHDRGRFNMLPGALVIAGVLVLVSRLMDLQPGFLYGILGGVVFGVELQRRTESHLASATALLTLAVSFVAWILWVPVSAQAAEPDAGFWIIAAEVALGGTFIAGLESVVIGLLPIRYLQGETIRSWSGREWLVVYTLALFAFVLVVMRPESPYGSDTTEENIRVLVTATIFGALSIAFWAAFRLRERSAKRSDLPAGEVR